MIHLFSYRRLLSFLFMFCGASASDSRAKVETYFEVGAESQSWSYETRSTDLSVQQWEMPLQVVQSSGPWIWSGRVSLISTDSEIPEQRDVGLSGIGRLGARIQRQWNGGRLWTFLDARHSGVVNEQDEDEIQLVGVLEQGELDLPWTSADFGNQVRGGALFQLVQRPQILIQAGAEGRWRSAFTLRSDGLEVDPAEELRLGLSADHELLGLYWRHGIWREVFGTTQVDTRDAYSAGGIWRLESEFQESWSFASAGAKLSLLWSEDGELLQSRFFDGAPLRSGNRVATHLWWNQVGLAWNWQASLRTVHFRGFSGSLGHSGRFVPGLGVSHALGGGHVHFRLDRAIGTLRENESLRGLGFRLSWTSIGGRS